MREVAGDGVVVGSVLVVVGGVCVRTLMRLFGLWWTGWKSGSVWGLVSSSMSVSESSELLKSVSIAAFVVGRGFWPCNSIILIQFEQSNSFKIQI